MMRATGFFLGTVLMLAVFLFALSAGISPMPVKKVDSHETDLPEGPAATAELPVEDGIDSVTPPAVDTAGLDEADPLEVTGSDPAATAAVPVEHGVDSVVHMAADTASLEEADPPEVAGSGLELDPQSWNQSLAAFDTADRNDATAVSRYLVWSPFHSKWAAQGFARRLTVATDVPVEVVNEGPGNYQVVFSYRDDGERQAMVERIETVTGLELE
jgi:hypothetical protein